MTSTTVEIFRTDVEDATEAESIILELQIRYPMMKANFDLDDCDRILRVAGEMVNPEHIIEIMRSFNRICELLE